MSYPHSEGLKRALFFHPHRVVIDFYQVIGILFYVSTLELWDAEFPRLSHLSLSAKIQTGVALIVENDLQSPISSQLWYDQGLS
jgi:hypothetical protein